MRLVFVGIDPATNGVNCPAVFLDAETGDLLMQGSTVTDPLLLAEVAKHSPVADHESVVRLPARMKGIILAGGSDGTGPTVCRTDRRDDDLGSASGDAGRLHAERS